MFIVMQCLHYAKTIGLVTNNLKNDKQLQIIYPFPIILFPLMLQCYVYQTRHSPLLEVFLSISHVWFFFQIGKLCIKQILFLFESFAFFQQNQANGKMFLCIIAQNYSKRTTTTNIKTRITEILFDEASKYMRM